MAFAGAVFLVLGFVLFLKLFSLVDHAKRVFQFANKALIDIRDPALDDEAKEKALQGYAKQLFKLFFLLTVGAAIALLLPAGIIWLLDKAHVLSFDDVVLTTLSWEFLGGSTLFVIIAMRLMRKRGNEI